MVSRELDSWFQDSLKDDYQIFDGKFDIEITHFDKLATTVDLRARVINNPEIKTTVKDCIFRSLADRNGASVSQIRERFRAIGNDMLEKIDTVIECPLLNGLVITEGDKAMVVKTKMVYMIIAIDHATIQSRYRLGCQRFV